MGFVTNMISEMNIDPKISSKYIFCKNLYGDRIVKSFIFNSPLNICEAISKIRSDEYVKESLSFYRRYNSKTLEQIQKDLLSNDLLNKLKVKGMVNYGQTAYVFETEYGDILKITNRDHFLGRRIEKFDCPIKSFGKMGPKSFCYYYFVEKTSNDVSRKEMDSCINEIRKSGYKVVDCRIDQFGKSKDGNIFLIDPECARINNLWGLFKYKFMKIKSFIKMMK